MRSEESKRVEFKSNADLWNGLKRYSNGCFKSRIAKLCQQREDWLLENFPEGMDTLNLGQQTCPQH